MSKAPGNSVALLVVDRRGRTISWSLIVERDLRLATRLKGWALPMVELLFGDGIEATRLIASANERVRGANVRALHVLAPASMKADSAVPVDDPAPQQAAPAVPVERRPPPDGYRRATEAHRQAAPPSRLDPGIGAAVERQTKAMRELSRRAFSVPDVVVDDVSAPIEQARVQRRRQAATTEAAALRRARQERGQGRGSGDVNDSEVGMTWTSPGPDHRAFRSQNRPTDPAWEFPAAGGNVLDRCTQRPGPPSVLVGSRIQLSPVDLTWLRIRY
ncbi:hypothetical protein [Streptomyces niveus]|uniref:hypothetical protein n=1 Tax=Streptomyces niveus TaxID=193462 RepID=UPI0033C70493